MMLLSPLLYRLHCPTSLFHRVPAPSPALHSSPCQLLTYLNYRGLTIVGTTAVVLGIFGFLPFVALTVIALPKIKPARW